MPEYIGELGNDLLSVPSANNPDFRWSLKREKFCYHFARMGHLGKAEQAAGFAPNSCSNFLMIDEIRERVQQEVRNLLRSAGENEDSVIARWAKWADVDMGDYFSSGWELKDIDSLSEDARKCIKKVKISNNQFGRNIDFELHDASQANIHLANMMGILKNDDGAGASAEEKAKSIKQMLQEMNEVNGLKEPTLEGSAGDEPKVTH